MRRKPNARSTRCCASGLLELRAQLGIRFPVYLLVTKADLLAGFAEYFSHYGRAECAQVGFHVPARAKRGAGLRPARGIRPRIPAAAPAAERRLPELLAAQTDARQREMTYLLPQQIADLQDMLGQFVAEVFSVSSYEPMPMLRGVYLTSGTQEGTAFDRVMSGIKRFLKIEGGCRRASVRPGAASS